MADGTPPAASSSPKSGAKKEVLGLPVWMWGTGAVVLVGAYLYLRHSAGASSASSQQTPAGSGQPVAVVGSPTGLSLEQFLLLLEDMQGSRSKHSHGRHGGGHHHHPPGPDPGGPERRWLIQQTGSQRPWTFLFSHHEHVVKTPGGGWRIVKDHGRRR